MSKPLVSVVIPAFNRDSLLPRAIESVKAQTWRDWEIVLVDDGSVDQTPQLARQWEAELGSAFHYIRQDNAGCCVARNTGIEASRGQFVAFLDSDDEFLPQKLERQLRLFAIQPELRLVYSDYSFVDLDGRFHPSTFDRKCPWARQVESVEVAPGLKVCTGTLFDMLLRGYFVATIVGLVRRDVLAQIRFSPGLRYSAEWLFYLQIVRHFPVGFVDEPLALHHHVGGSVTRTSKAANVRNYLDLLCRIERVFPDLAAPQRQVLNSQIAQAALQVAYQSHAAGDYRSAYEHFLASLHYHWSAAALGGAIEDWCRAALHVWAKELGQLTQPGLR